MIARIAKPGNSFSGVLNYALQPKKGAEILGGNMAGRDAKALTEEFMQTRNLNPRVSKPVFHVALSLRPGERLDDAQWAIVTREFMADMDFRDDHQWVAIRHNDTGHDHVHIIACRVGGAGGPGWSNFAERARSAKACRKAEKAFNLQSGARIDARRSGIRYTVEEREMFKRTGKWPPRVVIAKQIEQTLRSGPAIANLRDLQNRLMLEHEILLTAHFNREGGEIRGLSYSRGEDHFSARQLTGRATLPAVKELLNDGGEGPMSQAEMLIGSEPVGKPMAPSATASSDIGIGGHSPSRQSSSLPASDGSIVVSKDLDKWTFLRLTEINRKKREAAFQRLVAALPPTTPAPRQFGNSPNFHHDTPDQPEPQEERAYDMSVTRSAVPEAEIK